MGWPLVGQMWTFFRAFTSGRPDSFLDSFTSRFGRTGIYRTFLYGCPSIIVTNPEICKRVLTNDQQFVPGYPKATKRIFGNRSFHGVSLSEHKRLRRLTAAPINGMEALSLFVSKIEDILVTTMESWAELGRPIPLMNEMNKVTYKVIANILFGASVDDYDLDKMESLFYDLGEGFLAIPINLPGFNFHGALKARRKLVKIFKDSVEKKRVYKNKKDQAMERKDVLSDLLMVEDENGEKLDEEAIVDASIMFMLNGLETTSHGSMWAAIYLKEHPEIFRKLKYVAVIHPKQLRILWELSGTKFKVEYLVGVCFLYRERFIQEEQEEAIKRRPPTQKGLTLQDIKQMEYLSKVVSETLRKSNLAVALFREATTDIKLNGYLVPKGWKVIAYLRGLHLDPDNYAKPEEFDPLRWEEKAKAGTFLPFGAGGKLCPGMELAKLEMSIFLHHYVLHYDMERLNPDSPVVYLPGPKPVDHCLVRFKKANK